MDLLAEGGTARVEEIACRTRTVAALREDNVIVVWLRFELEGVNLLRDRNKWGIPEGIIYSAVCKWNALHRIQDTDQLKDLIKQKLYRKTRGWGSEEIDKKIFALPYDFLDPSTITLNARILQKPLSSLEAGTTDDMLEITAMEMVNRGTAEQIIARFKNAVHDYINNVYAEALQEKALKEGENSELKTKLDKLERGLLKNKVKRLWRWIKTHKRATTFLTILASIFTILGINYKDVVRVFIDIYRFIISLAYNR